MEVFLNFSILDELKRNSKYLKRLVNKKHNIQMKHEQQFALLLQMQLIVKCRPNTGKIPSDNTKMIKMEVYYCVYMS